MYDFLTFNIALPVTGHHMLQHVFALIIYGAIYVGFSYLQYCAAGGWPPHVATRVSAHYLQRHLCMIFLPSILRCR
jgi:hypothetical protein